MLRPSAPKGDSGRPGLPGGDVWAATVLAGVLVVGGWVWASEEMATWLVARRWLHIPASSVPGLLRRLPSHLGDPGRAWPAPAGTAVPSPLLWYGCALTTVTGALAAGWLGWLGWHHVRSTLAGAGRPRGSPGRQRVRAVHGVSPAGGAGWASRRDLGAVRLRRAGRSHRLVLGRRPAWPATRHLLATEARHSVLVLGPTQSGKTSGLAVPALLEWSGPVIATSVKDDLASTSLAWRARQGPCWVFDPTRSSGMRPLASWTPLAGCVEWSSAQRMAGWLVEATPGRAGLADAAFWYAAAAKQLAPLLLAAARAGATMADVVRWTNTCAFDEPRRLLEVSAEEGASLALAACEARDPRILSSVSTTLETVLAPFEDPVVAASTEAAEIDLVALLGTGGSLYLCGPSHEQHRVQGLFAAIVSCAVAVAIQRVNDTGRPLSPPLLLVLDEAANIAPIRDLDTLASTGAGMGIQLVTVCQDLAQLATRYGSERSRTIANNHRAKLLLSGVSDLATLDLVSGLAGETALREDTFTYDLRDGRRTRSSAVAFRRLAPPDELRRIRPGAGLLIYGHLPPVRLQLRPWYADRRLRRRASAEQAEQP